MGYCSIIEIISGTFIYEKKISSHTLFLTIPITSLYPTYFSFLAINRNGQVCNFIFHIIYNNNNNNNNNINI